ncbi:MAG: hypothetical protein IJ197_09585 [Bacteroidaceae bacterium]|nr:hypothetical protein [Bacteroidaceae bacterium]
MMEQQHTTDELQALKAPMALLRERLHREDIVSLDQIRESIAQLAHRLRPRWWKMVLWLLMATYWPFLLITEGTRSWQQVLLYAFLFLACLQAAYDRYQRRKRFDRLMQDDKDLAKLLGHIERMRKDYSYVYMETPYYWLVPLVPATYLILSEYLTPTGRYVLIGALAVGLIVLFHVINRIFKKHIHLINDITANLNRLYWGNQEELDEALDILHQDSKEGQADT